MDRSILSGNLADMEPTKYKPDRIEPIMERPPRFCSLLVHLVPRLLDSVADFYRISVKGINE